MWGSCLGIFFFIINSMVTAESEGTVDKSLVQTKNGLLRGVRGTTTEGRKFYSFMGIPYAEPPVGNLRFLEPRPSKPWTGVLNVDKLPELCLQRPYFVTTNSGVEDCLNLNVYSHMPDEVEGKHPVLVFIHGGAFVFGGSAVYQPHVLLREDVILIVMNYRLGVFGFLSTEDSVLPGNMGIKDQRMALQWIQANIASFGGDPSKVTIFGESAGGSSVHIHILSPGSSGLFKNGISQSGTSLCPWARGRSGSQRKISETIATHFQCPLERDSERFLECLQNVDGNELLNFVSKGKRLSLSPANWTPRVDGDVLPDDPATLLREGRYNKINFITGVNRDEGALYLTDLLHDAEGMENLNENFETFAPAYLFFDHEDNGLEMAKDVHRAYLGGIHLSPKTINESAQMIGDSYFAASHDMSWWFHSHDEKMKTYTYQMNYKGKYSILQLLNGMEKMPKHWVTHTDELHYLFKLGGVFEQLNKTTESPEDVAFSRIMTKLWANFAATGTPTPDDSLGFVWERSSPPNFAHLDLTLKPKMSLVTDMNRLKFWALLKTKENGLLFPDEPTFEPLSYNDYYLWIRSYVNSFQNWFFH